MIDRRPARASASGALLVPALLRAKHEGRNRWVAAQPPGEGGR